MMTHKNLAFAISLLCTAVLLSGCGGDGQGTGGGTHGPPQLNVVVEPSEVSVRRGETAAVRVIVASAEARTELAVVRLLEPPDGITVGDAVLQPGDGAEAVLAVAASNSAPTGGPHALHVEVAIGGQRVTTPVELTIGGQPGELDTSFGEAGVVEILNEELRNGRLTHLTATEDGALAMVAGASAHAFKVDNDGLDEDFGVGGVVALSIPGAARTNCTMAVSSNDERIAAACLGRDPANGVICTNGALLRSDRKRRLRLRCRGGTRDPFRSSEAP